MKREIVLYGDPVLRKKAQEVVCFDSSVIELVNQMIAIMNQKKGIGLAAPQVGESIRLFISKVHSLDAEGFPLCGEPKVYINPKISILDPTPILDSEGCLSLPKIYEDVSRPSLIKVDALSEKGEFFSEIKQGFCARVILHENDHLNGVIFLDRIAKERKKELLKKYKLSD